MRKIVYLSILILAVPTNQSPAQHGPETHIIDVQLNECYNKNPTTLGIISCELKGYKMWYEQMEQNYDELVSLLNDEQKQKIKDNQIEWDKFHKSMLLTNEMIYHEDKIVKVAAQKTDLVRQRAKQLHAYIDYINQKKAPKE